MGMDTGATRVDAVGAVVVRSDGQVLVIRRGKAPGKGEWTLPGGHVEAGETYAAAVERELREETGLDVHAIEEIAVVPIDRDGFSYAIHEYLCAPRRDDVPNPALVPGDDAADARWIDPADLEALHVSAQARDVVGRAIARRSAGARSRAW